MHWFCPNCWHEVEEAGSVCPACGASPQTLDSRSFAEKLVAALRHPEPAAAVRAAQILGTLKPTDAAPALMNVLEESHDPYLLEAAAWALGEIGNAHAVPLLRSLFRSSYLVARIAAAEALGKLAGPEAISALEDAREDASEAVRKAVNRALSQVEAHVSGDASDERSPHGEPR